MQENGKQQAIRIAVKLIRGRKRGRIGEEKK
jgi:hypothetical protein